MAKSYPYSVLLQPLSKDDGGGWLATVPDLPGCRSDGETQLEALKNVQDAIRTWLDVTLVRDSSAGVRGKGLANRARPNAKRARG